MTLHLEFLFQYLRFPTVHHLFKIFFENQRFSQLVSGHGNSSVLEKDRVQPPFVVFFGFYWSWENTPWKVLASILCDDQCVCEEERIKCENERS
jgi:hypothetical protein